MDLSSIGLTKLPPEIGDLRWLYHLDLSGNGLTGLPTTIGQLTSLEQLNLRDNRLRSLPPQLWYLSRLRILNVSSNEIGHLRPGVGNLRLLEQLNVSHNKLVDLPAELAQLSSLETLDVSYNDLAILPNSFREFARRPIAIRLSGNTRLRLPSEILHVETPKVLDYYFRSRDARPLLEAKLLLVGRGGGGKTSLVQRLLRNTFNESQPTTHGIQIDHWNVVVRDGTARLNVWDFGGQEIMRATHRFFLSARSIYLVVLSGREGREDADAEYWLKLVESFGPESPTIIVLNKIHQHGFSLNRRGLQKKYPAIRAFIETDCADGLGMDDLRNAIQEEADGLPSLRDAFPASWFRIKEYLAATPHDYITFEQFRTVCSARGESDADSQDKLATYLHTLGIALNYRDDPRLLDTHVLNPKWVTAGIYAILNSSLLERAQGELCLGDLQKILPLDRYPVVRHAFLLDLMCKFDLCFAFPEDRSRYLVPELLGRDEPAVVDEFDTASSLNFEYHYRILPEGLFPRFIVRSRGLSVDLPRWRTGVVLSFEKCQALIRADSEEKKVYISVAGSIDDRRRLLAVIRSDFERIHRDITGLSVDEMIPVPGHPTACARYRDLQVFERQGVRTTHMVVGDSAIEVNVRELLEGVSIARMDGSARHAAKLFLVYSQKDEGYGVELETHLKLLERQGLVSTWSDRQIRGGEHWNEEILSALEGADLVALLVSADMIASEYVWGIEMKRALEREKRQDCRVIPIIVRACDWQSAPFGKLNALPGGSGSIAERTNRDAAWADIAKEIRSLLTTPLRKRGPGGHADPLR